MHPADAARFWNAAADSFDDEPDHGLTQPAVRQAWLTLLTQVLPAAPARLVDLGCGTGTLSVLLAQRGHVVHGVDLSPRMIERAEAKARAVQARATFAVADVAYPPFGTETFDVALSRHVVWALPDAAAALQRWVDLIRPGGLLVLIEGHWDTGAGLGAAKLQALVAPLVRDTERCHLTDPALWGKEIGDERFMLVARR